jgi:putative SOS response-associated peptidase YedK
MVGTLLRCGCSVCFCSAQELPKWMAAESQNVALCKISTLCAFYEWQRIDAKTKQPFAIAMKDGTP